MSEKQMKILGWVATFMSVMMYVAYFPTNHEQSEP